MVCTFMMRKIIFDIIQMNRIIKRTAQSATNKTTESSTVHSRQPIHSQLSNLSISIIGATEKIQTAPPYLPANVEGQYSGTSPALTVLRTARVTSSSRVPASRSRNTRRRQVSLTRARLRFRDDRRGGCRTLR